MDTTTIAIHFIVIVNILLFIKRRKIIFSSIITQRIYTIVHVACKKLCLIQSARNLLYAKISWTKNLLHKSELQYNRYNTV